MRRGLLIGLGLAFVLVVVVVSIITTNNRSLNQLSFASAIAPTLSEIHTNTPTSNFIIPTPNATNIATPSITPNVVNSILGPKIGAVSLNSKYEDLLKLFGEPKLRTIVHGNGSPQWEYSNGLTLYLGDFDTTKYSGNVWRIIVEAPFDGVTTEGLKLGDTKETFCRLYANFGVKTPLLANQVQIKDDKNVSLYIDFDKEGKVSAISLGRDLIG